MKIKRIELINFKRFTHLIIEDLPETAKLVVLVGSNGSGKTSLFEAFRRWMDSYVGAMNDPEYLSKGGLGTPTRKIEFHSALPTQPKKIIYIRSAYRNEPDFTMNTLNKVGAAFDTQELNRLIDNDSRVSKNYQRIVSQTVAGVFTGQHDNKKVSELREELIGRIRKSMKNVFDNLTLQGTGDPLSNGSFYFQKGIVQNFHFKNLSAGEKAAFDILLDIIIKRQEFNDTIFCIDEPDLHMHTKLQAKLLEEMYTLIPNTCQLWISTHSIGMIRKAVELQKKFSNEVVFLDFHNLNPDAPITLKPTQIARDIWKQILEVALDDLAQLVVPKRIIFCEGEPVTSPARNKEFDAQCLRKIFAQEFPDTDFISAGNADSVQKKTLDIISTLQILSKGIEIVRLIDRDDHSSEQISELQSKGTKVLKQRDLESYLWDDEIIRKLCSLHDKSEMNADCLQIKKNAIQNSITRGNPADDVKSASGEMYTQIIKKLGLTGCGNDTASFSRDTLAPLITSETMVYKDLKKEIFE
jgi:predicted ATPase